MMGKGVGGRGFDFEPRPGDRPDRQFSERRPVYESDPNRIVRAVWIAKKSAQVRRELVASDQRPCLLFDDQPEVVRPIFNTPGHWSGPLVRLAVARSRNGARGWLTAIPRPRRLPRHAGRRSGRHLPRVPTL